MSESTIPERRVDSLVLASIVLILVCIYALSTSPFPLLEDDSLFILASYFAGVAHSPGYPTYVLLSQIVHLLPIDNVALRVHYFSGFVGALACGGIYWILISELKVGRLAATTAAVVLGLSTLFWGQAIIAEVYTLNALFFVLLLLSVFLLARSETISKKQLLGFGFLYGLSLGNHWPLTVLMSPVLAVIASRRYKIIPGCLPYLCAGLLIGLLPYVWMIVRSWDGLAYGHMGSLDTIEKVFYFISREVYATADNKEIAGVAEKILYSKFYASEFMQQFGLPGTLLVFLGFARQWQVLSWRIAAALSLSLFLPAVLILLVSFTYTQLEIESMRVYPLPLYVVAGLWLGIGLDAVFDSIGTLSDNTRLRNGLVSIVLILSVAGILYKNRNNFEIDDWAVSHGQEVLDRLSNDSILFVMDDWSMAVISYLQLVEHYRPDIILYSEYATFLPNRLFPYFGISEEQRIQSVQDFIIKSDRPVFSLHNPDLYGLQAYDHGLFYEISLSKSSLDSVAIQQYFESILPRRTTGTWEQLHWQTQVRRLIQSSRDVEGLLDLPREHFTVPQEIADYLMSRDQIQDSSMINSLLREAGTNGNGKTDLQISRLMYLQGKYLEGVGADEVAIEMYEESLALYPVAYNPALINLAALHQRHCELEKLHRLLVSYPALVGVETDGCRSTPVM